MIKLLLLALMLWIVWKWVTKPRHGRSTRPPEPSAKALVHMLECAHCQVRFPAPEAHERAGKPYCCAEHAAQADGH